jgi:cytochrome c oxidase subunit 4
MLRSSVIRATRSSASLIPSAAARPAVRPSRAAPAVCILQQQARQAHAISNPTLANIEKRWEDMPPQEQADLWMSLRDRMKVDWKEMTMQEKKAGAYYFYLCHWISWAANDGRCHFCGSVVYFARPQPTFSTGLVD